MQEKTRTKVVDMTGVWSFYEGVLNLSRNIGECETNVKKIVEATALLQGAAEEWKLLKDVKAMDEVYNIYRARRGSKEVNMAVWAALHALKYPLRRTKLGSTCVVMDGRIFVHPGQFMWDRTFGAQEELTKPSWWHSFVDSWKC